MYTIKVGVEIIGIRKTYKEAMRLARNYHFSKVYDENGKLIAIHSKAGMER